MKAAGGIEQAQIFRKEFRNNFFKLNKPTEEAEKKDSNPVVEVSNYGSK